MAAVNIDIPIPAIVRRDMIHPCDIGSVFLCVYTCVIVLFKSDATSEIVEYR